MRRSKDFDCVAFKCRAQEKIYQKTRHFTPEEEVAWYREQAASGPFGQWLKKFNKSQPEQPVGAGR